MCVVKTTNKQKINLFTLYIILYKLFMHNDEQHFRINCLPRLAAILYKATKTRYNLPCQLGERMQKRRNYNDINK